MEWMFVVVITFRVYLKQQSVSNHNDAYTGNRIQVADLQDQSNSHYTIQAICIYTLL
jgi:hypothetical protein